MESAVKVLKAGLLLCLLVSSPAIADRVVFKNGDVITGTVTSLSGGKIAITTDYAPRIVVAADQVVSLSTDDAVQVTTRDGERFNGAVESKEGQLVVGTALQKELVLGDVAKIARTKGLSLTESDWAHKIDFAATLTNGNTDTESFALLTESVLKRGQDEHTLLSSVFKDKDQDVTTRDQLDVGYSFRRFMTGDKWFWGANGSYFRDRLLGIDPRVTVGALTGYRFWDDSLGSLTVEFGLAAVYEDLGIDDETNPAARWALNYRRLLTGERLEFFHRHQILKIMGGGRGEVIDASTGLRFMFNDWWDANIRADIRHETEPPIGSHRSDVTYAVGVGVRF